MSGRYKESNIATHPAYSAGEAATANNDQHHADVAAELLPGDISEAEKVVWLRVAPELSRLGRLKKHFIDFVREYCVVKVRMDETRSHLDSIEWTYVTTGRHGKQVKSRPEVAQLNDDWRKWNSLVAQLGLSPATELRFNDRQGSLFDDDFDRI